MAMYCDESVDSYICSSYNPYSYRCPRPKGWRQKSYLASYGDGETYFDNYHRAQLKSILSQINPNLTPRLRKANTKDVGVQVNPKTDASVQCSLGPRTLLTRKRDALRKKRQEFPASESPSARSGVRYPRTLAVYSPIATRRLPSFLEDEKRDGERPGGDDPGMAEKGQGNDAEISLQEQSTNHSNGQLSPERDVGKTDQQSATNETKTETEKSAPNDLTTKGRIRFQFLEQKYGYYHCRDCNLRWESAYVWCVQGTSKVYFKQFCRTCQRAFNPYRVEDITCQMCKKARCVCSVTARHVDPKRPHRQDLCGRCKGKRISCDSTFSFKYII